MAHIDAMATCVCGPTEVYARQGIIGSLRRPLYGESRSNRKVESNMARVEIDLLWNAVRVRPTGMNRVWALRRQIDVPYEQIVSVEQDVALAQNGPEGLRFPGTNVPGVYTAGTYWKFWASPKLRSFWVRRHPEKTIVLQLRGHHFDTICVEVDDPGRQVDRVRTAIADQASTS